MQYNVHLIFNPFSRLVSNQKINRYDDDDDFHLKIIFAVAVVGIMNIINYRTLTLAQKTNQKYPLWFISEQERQKLFNK